ncbi:MAG: type II secretion system protein GspK [Candidatus Brocadiia bacterium]
MTGAGNRRWRGDRGTVLIVTMWVVLVLAGLVLVFAHWARVEAIASANRESATQADAVARGALNYVISAVDGADGSTTGLEELNWEERRVGEGFFWVLRTNLQDDGQHYYGLTDEASKINLNSASSDMLLEMPNMTAELADAIIDWRDEDADVSPSGAEGEYYLLRRDPYYCKDAPFEAVEEVLLLRDGSEDVLYGEDRNRNGVLDYNEDDNGDGSLDRGFLDYATVYSVEPNTASDGEERVDVNSLDTDDLSETLREVVSDDRLFTVLQNTRRGRPFDNVLDFYFDSGLTLEEFAPIADGLTTVDEDELTGMVNVNTASREVLLCLPELDESDVDALLSRREDSETDLSSIAWVADALPQEKAVAIGSYITVRSYQFSADIVAVSGDGRAYRRYLAVVDAMESPPRVVRWQDLTHLGWPLDAGIPAALRRGEDLTATTLTASYR